MECNFTTLGLIPLLYNLGIGAFLAPLVRKSVNGLTKLELESEMKDIKNIESMLKDIDKDIANKMSLKDLKTKYLKGKTLKEKKFNIDLLLPYIYYKHSTGNKARNNKIENKSGNLFYRVNINKDGILKFITHGLNKRPAPSYKVENLFTKGKFTSWGGKKKKRKTRKKKKKKN